MIFFFFSSIQHIQLSIQEHICEYIGEDTPSIDAIMIIKVVLITMQWVWFQKSSNWMKLTAWEHIKTCVLLMLNMSKTLDIKHDFPSG